MNISSPIFSDVAVHYARGVVLGLIFSTRIEQLIAPKLDVTHMVTAPIGMGSWQKYRCRATSLRPDFIVVEAKRIGFASGSSSSLCDRHSWDKHVDAILKKLIEIEVVFES